MGITIEEIAKMAGVSKTTVSLVMNDHGSEYRISKATQHRIREIVARESFKPDPYARGFRMKKTGTIGLVVPDLTNWFFSRISHEIELVARKYDHQVFITCSDDDEETEAKVVRNLVDRRVDGLIVASVMKKDQITREISNLKIPVVYIDRRIESDMVSWVASDNYQGAYDLIDHMCSLGVEEIYYLGGLKNISTSRNRIRGYRQALEDNNISFDSEKVFEDDYTIAAGYRLARKSLEHCGRLPQAFFTASFTLLEGALQFVKETSGQIPDTLRIGTYDDHPFLDFLSIKIPSVKQDTGSIARTAFEMILDALAGRKVVQHKIIQPKLVIRR
ncbi:MAG: LacI family transcriptional regulator [Proteobacteria bacterium]|nr:LacI family transcriptional regulator [Pseudomonadota bacterium]